MHRRQPSFVLELSLLLSVLAAPALSQDLSLSFNQLGDQLREYKNGESWAKYLALPKDLLSGETTKGTSEPTRKLLKRFDKLSSDSTYAKVTALPSFEPAYEALRLAVDPTGTLRPPSVTTRVGDRMAMALSDPVPTHKHWYLHKS